MNVAHNLLVIAYHVLSGGVSNDLSSACVDERDRERTFQRFTRRLEAVGHQVAVAPAT